MWNYSTGVWGSSLALTPLLRELVKLSWESFINWSWGEGFITAKGKALLCTCVCAGGRGRNRKWSLKRMQLWTERGHKAARSSQITTNSKTLLRLKPHCACLNVNEDDFQCCLPQIGCYFLRRHLHGLDNSIFIFFYVPFNCEKGLNLPFWD